MRLEPFSPKDATPREYEALNALMNRIRGERLPDDPPIPLDEDIRRWQHIPTFIDVFAWIVWNADRTEIAAEGDVSVQRVEHNRHVVDFNIFVHPQWRRRGLGSRLLEWIATVTAQEDRRLLITSTYGSVPAGEAFLRRVGAKMALLIRSSQLDLRDLNRELIRIWQERAGERAKGFDLLLWSDGTPEAELEKFAHLLEAMNLAPRGELEVEDFHWTPEQIKEFEQQDRARGVQVWTLIARERSTGNLAGFTSVSWHPNRPEFLGQRWTAVLPQYQNRGLGRWLKAAMLEKVLGERPQVKRIRTGNAEANAPMLKINTELGFKPIQAHSVWQAELSKVQGYLASVDAAKLQAIG